MTFITEISVSVQSSLTFKNRVFGAVICYISIFAGCSVGEMLICGCATRKLAEGKHATNNIVNTLTGRSAGGMCSHSRSDHFDLGLS